MSTGRDRRWLDLQPGVVWHGEADEFARLLGCVGRHCTCQTLHACGAHQLLSEQSTLDHLVFARGARERLLDGEWNAGLLTGTYASAPFRPRRGKRRPGRAGLVALAFAALVGLMSLGGAWHSPATSAPPIGAWQTR